MDAALVANLERFVSAPRLQRYRDAGTSDLETAVLYGRNVQLAEAILPSLALFEVVLRNAVHTTLTRHTGTEWWFSSVLHQQSYDIIQKLVSDLVRRQRHPPSVGKVLSEITFGFWPKLFAHRYQGVWWDAPQRLLSQVLPYHPNVARDTRKTFEERLEYFAVLRNRVMHHEAIFQGVNALNRPVVPIETLHGQLIETIGWIDADAGALITCLDRFGDVFAAPARTSLESSIKRTFGIP